MNKVKHIETLSILMVFVLIFSVSIAAADDIKDMLKKLKSSDKVEMRIPSSVAAARGIQIREDLRNEAATEAARESVRESIQAMAAEEVKTAEFECGKILKDINGNWVRLEEYVVIGPKDSNGIAQDNQFKLMILNERTIDGAERLDYFKNISIFDKPLPKEPDLFREAVKYSWGSDTPTTAYWLTNVYNTAGNRYNNIEDKVEYSHINGDGTRYYDSQKQKYVPLFKDYEFKVNDVPKISYTGTQSNGSDRVFTIGDPAVSATTLNSTQFSSWYNTNCPAVTSEDGGVGQTTNINTKYFTELYYIIDDNGTPTSTAADIWNQELIFKATEFGDRTIDIIAAPDVFIQSGIGGVQ